MENLVLLPLLKHLTLNMAGPISGMQITGAVPSFFEDVVEGFLLPMAPTTTVPAPFILFLELLFILDNISATMHVSFLLISLAILMLSFVQRSVQRYSIAGRETYGWTWCDLVWMLNSLCRA